MNSCSKIFLLMAVAGAFLLAAGADLAFAQGKPIPLTAASAKKSESKPDVPAVSPLINESTEAERTRLENLERYRAVEFIDLVNAYWGFEYFKPDNENDVANYVRFTECGLYRKYKNDNFIWPDIYKVSQAYLRKLPKQKEVRISFRQPVALDRYNTDKKWFGLTADTQYLNVTAIEFVNLNTIPESRTCGPLEYSEDRFPRQAAVKLQAPFSITYIPMDEMAARGLITYLEKIEKKEIQIKGENRMRYAYVNFQVTLTGLSSVEASGATFTGRLEGYDIYADVELKMPIYSWGSGKRKIRKPIANNTAPVAVAPVPNWAATVVPNVAAPAQAAPTKAQP